MRNNNKKLPLLVLSTLFLIPSLISCGNNENKVPINDHDSDGLINEIDPDPENNLYNVNQDIGDDKLSKTYRLKVDYNDILKVGYQPDVALLCSFIMNDTDGDDIVFSNNVYEPSKELDVPIFGQIGCEDLQHIEAEKHTLDPYDIAESFIAHHTFIDKDNSKHQVFFIAIKGYINGQEQWISNFDIGAADEEGNITEGYKEFWNGSEHPEWLHKQNHKGFDVTATRLKKQLDKYIKEHENKDAQKLLVLTGHSRSGAVANLIAKQYIDEGVDSRAYSFNPPAVTKKFIGDESSKYNNKIFVFNNTNDLVSRVPCPSQVLWGFKRYGTIFDVNVAEHKDLYRHIYDTDYVYNDDEFLNIMEYALADLSLIVKPEHKENSVLFNSNNVYEKWHYPNSFVGLESATFSTESEVNDFKNFVSAHCNSTVGIYSTDLVEGKYLVKWHSKGALILNFIDDLIKGDLEDYGYYIYLLRREVLELLDMIINKDDIESLIEIKDRMLGAHQQRNAPLMVTIINNKISK